VACYETATWNGTTCVWDVTGSQPAQPTLVNCWDVFTFNTTTCVWDTSGSQPAAPTVACYETATFNTTTCVWDVTGSQPAAPTVACYETATFNTTTCAWDVTGSQPAQPTGLACYESSAFNTTTCAWVVTGSQPVQPVLACYETATFNTTTCTWDVTGTQSIPTGMSASNIELTKATMNWTAVSNAHHYDIRMRVQGSSTWTIALNNLYLTSVLKTGLTSGTTYEWEIRSACSSGSSSVSAWSSTQTFTTAIPCTTPVNTATTNIGINSATLGWDAVSGAWGYVVRYKQTSPVSSAWSYVTVNTNSYSLTGLASGGVYRWQIYSMCDANNTNNSSFSSNIIFTTATCNIALSQSTTNVVCNGGSTGAIDLSVIGGSGIILTTSLINTTKKIKI
jgi:hypothetical protein